jgi:hypothetical protein
MIEKDRTQFLGVKGAGGVQGLLLSEVGVDFPLR